MAMRRFLLVAVLAVFAAGAQAQTKAPPGKFSDGVVKIGLILDMAR
jgi:hypothetical protein